MNFLIVINQGLKNSYHPQSNNVSRWVVFSSVDSCLCLCVCAMTLLVGSCDL